MSANITTIPKGRPDHPSLDFDLLRAEGIKHLEHLATEVWTDFNAHDPGITILELLSYAITDLGYRTRMIPVADLMTRKDPSKKIWFETTEVLPNAPVTERDFRKLLIDVKGVKNAWLRKARPDEIIMMLYRIGWVFPALMNEKYEWDVEKLRKVDPSFPEIVLDKDNKPTPESKKRVEDYLKCLDDFVLRFEFNPKLEEYASLIKDVSNKIDLKDAIKVLEVSELYRFVKERALGASDAQINKSALNASNYLAQFVEEGAKPQYFLTEWTPLLKKYAGYNQDAYDKGQFAELRKSYRGKALDNIIVELGYTVETDSNVFLKGLQDLLEKQQFENRKNDLPAYFVGNEIKTDLVGNASKLIGFLNEGLDDNDKLSEAQEKLIKDHINGLKKQITEADRTEMIAYLDGSSSGNTENRKAFVKLWQDELPKKTGKTEPDWEEIEKEEYDEINPTAVRKSRSAKAAAEVVTQDYAAFNEIISFEWPTLYRISDGLIQNYTAINANDQRTLTISNLVVRDLLTQAYGQQLDPFVIKQIIDSVVVRPESVCLNFSAFLLDHLCNYGINGLTTNPNDAHEFYPNPIALNGIYHITLDMDDSVNTANPKAVEEVVNRAMKRLHENRALCEDFLEPQVVQQKPVQFCLHLDVSPDADERKVMAEVIWRFQEYLTPTLRFRTFKQMRDLGLHCDEIYDGPLLQNGFLDNAEVDAATLLSFYYHSDLVRIAMETPGVLGVRELKVKATPELAGSTFLAQSEYKVKVSGDNQKTPFIKRVIDLCDSCFYVSKGALPTIKLAEAALHEHLEWLRLTQNCELCTEPGGHLPEGGIFRPDLSEYRSVQYDLPDVYTVGDNRPIPDAPPLRKAQARHLQAYLAFFDQIMAAYLAQLGQVNQLLSTDQDTKVPTRILPALYEVPGVRDLIENQAIFDTNPQEWTIAIGNYVPPSEQNALRSALGDIASSPKSFPGFYAFRQALFTVLDANQYEVYSGHFQDYFWAKYISNEANNYRAALLAAAETPAHRRQQRNQLVDHLLARFGESFTDYVHALLTPDGEPEDNPWRQDFEGYLEDKARFLREVAQLSHDRGRGYNYRKLNPVNRQPDVWLTNNVAGVKKRVSRLTGIDHYAQKSLIAEPPYRLDIVMTQNKQGTAQYRIVMKRRPEALDASENPLQMGPLLYSQKYSSAKKAQDKATELYKNIWKTTLYKVEISAFDPDKWVVKYTLADNELISDPMGEEEAKGLLSLLQDLVQPGKGEVEGCHLIEHVLLRPNDPKDKLLQIPLGCDPKETPYDPYSFWLTVVLPNWTSRFKHADFRYFFEQTFRAETPSHIAIRFCWVDLNTMYLFEDAYRKWLIEKAKCSPSECHVTDAANALIDLLNTMPCTCLCDSELPSDKCVDC